ncbi:MAG: acyl-CoA/acyl-ACP dehydrogenase [Rhodospirillaceae bacterium]|nr:acyl-CoA/acyl-ACP dehydrogenase [Rhodospirillaceae bacterium]MCY4240019.1 acyl-CoA/acyl-ACP dehydrogenase [Rhodospirillaceae bacterium]MCY4311231.1 acyl-CoA/acyl-ACP dehydrogenase [Rhodospirillaceae bacterium]
MDFSFSDEQRQIEEAVGAICNQFCDNYWLDRDKTGEFPHEFHAAMAEGGWLGIAMPEAQGGAGLGMTEAAIMMRRVAQSPGAMSACSTIHMNIFGPHPIVIYGTEEQKRRWLPDLIGGKIKACFGVTEPNVGLDTTNIKTRAARTGPQDNAGYTINGEKIWTSTAQTANYILLLTRTTPKEDCIKPTDGLTLFFTELDRDKINVREIEKMGRKAVDSNVVFIEDLQVPANHRIGEEGQGFQCLLHGLNPERCLVASEAVGIGQQALRRAADYARERVVFGRPIGQNQAIQHPLADSWAELEAAWLMVLNAAAMYDAGLPCGPQCNAAKHLGAEAGFRACERALLAHGGMGYAKEYHVERLLREVMICRIAPVSREMILSHIAVKQLGLPKSY